MEHACSESSTRPTIGTRVTTRLRIAVTGGIRVITRLRIAVTAAVTAATTAAASLVLVAVAAAAWGRLDTRALSWERCCVRYCRKHNEESEDRETHGCWKNCGVLHDVVSLGAFLIDFSGLSLSDFILRQ